MVFLTIIVIFFNEKTQAEFRSALIVPPSPQWHGTKQMGVTVNLTNGMGITNDGLGNIYITCHTTGGLSGQTQIGDLDLFIHKYNFGGVLQGSIQLGMKDEMIWGDHITTDRIGNVYVTGIINGKLPGQNTSEPSYILKYSSNGVLQWAKPLTMLVVSAITADHAGNILATGFTMSGEWPHDTGQLLIQKYNSNGALLWKRQVGPVGKRTASLGMTINPAGNIFIVGFTNGKFFGQKNTSYVDVKKYELLIQKYNSNGALQWSRQMKLANKDTFAQAITNDHLGYLYITGVTAVNTDPLKAQAFVQKYDAKGVLLGSKQMGTENGNTQGMAIASDRNGNIYTSGFTTVSLFGQAQTGKLDLYVQKIDSSGFISWTRQMGSVNEKTTAQAITVDRFSNVYITGGTSGGLDGNTQSGLTDLFIQKYNTNGVLQ